MLLQFDKVYHQVVLYVNYLICMGMDIYEEHLKNDRNIIWK